MRLRLLPVGLLALLIACYVVDDDDSGPPIDDDDALLDDDDTVDDDDSAAPDDDDAQPDDDDAQPDDDDAGDDDSDPVCPFDEAELVADSPLPPQVPVGPSASTSVDGFSDEYLWDSSSYIKVGVREDWGGSIVFFGLDDGSPGSNSSNTIDANDTGREVQVALYDPDRSAQGCAWDASCASSPHPCPASITYLGWNPVQGGNRCNYGSGVDAVNNGSGELQVVTTPLHWNPNWEAPDCNSSGCSDSSLAWLRSDVTLTQTLRFVRTHVVELRYTVDNLAGLDHAATLQEMPTMYTANGNGGPDLWRLFDSAGTQIPIDTPAGNEDGFNYENFSSADGWVSMQNEAADYGVGILYENGLTTFQGWQLRSLPFNNVRSRFTFGLPAWGTVHARAYLVLGSLATVSSEAGWLLDNLPPFGFLDAPTGLVSPGPTAVSGWALDNRGVASVEAVVDEVTTVPLTYGSSRPDVCAAWPGYPSCDAVGFTGTVDLAAGDGCPHKLDIVATDTDGNSRLIASRLVWVGS